MHITDFTPEDIETVLARCQEAISNLAEKRRDVAMRMTGLAKTQRELERQASTTQRDVDALSAAKLLLVPIPEKVEQLRSKLAKTRVESQSTEISVRESGELKAQVVQLEKELIAACPHPFVLSAPGYQGYSSGGDEDRSEPGERFCALCDLHEYEYARWGGGEAGFKALVEAEHRLFGHCQREKISTERSEFRSADLKNIVATFTSPHALELLEKHRPQPTT